MLATSASPRPAPGPAARASDSAEKAQGPEAVPYGYVTHVGSPGREGGAAAGPHSPPGHAAAHPASPADPVSSPRPVDVPAASPTLEAGADCSDLAGWVAGVITAAGGNAAVAQVGSLLSADNPVRYKAVKERFMSLSILFDKYPELFSVEGRPSGAIVHTRVTSEGGEKASAPDANEAAHAVALRILTPYPMQFFKVKDVTRLVLSRLPPDVAAGVEASGGVSACLARTPTLFTFTGDSVAFIGPRSSPEPSSEFAGGMGERRDPSPTSTTITPGSAASSVGAPRDGAYTHGGRAYDGGYGSPSAFARAAPFPHSSPSPTGGSAWGGSAFPGSPMRGGDGTTSPTSPHGRGMRIERTRSDESGGLGGDGGLSRCLHIGNVPISMSEAELLEVLRKHGRVETIKLVNQKGRRFAFCNFQTIEDAVSAKNSLGRSDMWRYNVSFAKRETLPLPPQSSSPVTSPARPPVPATLVEQLVRQGYPLEQAAYFAGCVGVGPEGGHAAKQRNLVPSRHLWIGGLVNATRADVLDVFGPFGKIEHFKFIKGRRCAFVDYVEQRDAETAFHRMQGASIGGGYIDLGFGRPERASSAHTIGTEDLGLDDSHIPSGAMKPPRVSKHDPLYDLLTRPPMPTRPDLYPSPRHYTPHGGVLHRHVPEFRPRGHYDPRAQYDPYGRGGYRDDGAYYPTGPYPGMYGVPHGYPSPGGYAHAGMPPHMMPHPGYGGEEADAGLDLDLSFDALVFGPGGGQGESAEGLGSSALSHDTE